MDNERLARDERSSQDAPKRFSADEAVAWADGWNAAVREIDAEHRRVVAKELS